MTLAFAWSADRIAALGLGAAFLVFLYVYFFRVRRREGVAAPASAPGGAAQEATITVSGGYDPEVVIAKKGVPLTLVFDRQESSPCSDEVVLPEFGIRQALEPHAKTRIRVVPERAGEFPFTCGMNMLHGLLRVEE